MSLFVFVSVLLSSIHGFPPAHATEFDLEACKVITVVESYSLINGYFPANTTIPVDSTSTVTITNAPTSLSTTVTILSTVSSSAIDTEPIKPGLFFPDVSQLKPKPPPLQQHWITSTVYKTNVLTLTDCGIAECATSTITETIVDYTTVCPTKAASNSASAPGSPVTTTIPQQLYASATPTSAFSPETTVTFIESSISYPTNIATPTNLAYSIGSTILPRGLSSAVTSGKSALICVPFQHLIGHSSSAFNCYKYNGLIIIYYTTRPNDIVLSINIPTSNQKRDSQYLSSAGSPVSDCNTAVKISLQDGRLADISSGTPAYYYAFPNVQHAVFAPVPPGTQVPAGSTGIVFSINDANELAWNPYGNSTLDVIFELDSKSRVQAVFDGYLQPGSKRIYLQLQRVSADGSCQALPSSSLVSNATAPLTSTDYESSLEPQTTTPPSSMILGPVVTSASSISASISSSISSTSLPSSRNLFTSSFTSSNSSRGTASNRHASIASSHTKLPGISSSSSSSLIFGFSASNTAVPTTNGLSSVVSPIVAVQIPSTTSTATTTQPTELNALTSSASFPAMTTNSNVTSATTAPAASLVCGQVGRPNRQVLQYELQSPFTLATCFSYCASDSRCLSFYHGHSNCYLFNASVFNSGFHADVTSSYVAYDKNCLPPSNSSTLTMSPTSQSAGSSSIATSTSVPSSAACVPIPSPTYAPASTTSDCCEWYIINSTDNCATVEDMFNITDAYFRLLNPSIDTNCYNLLGGIAYCVSGLPQPITINTASAGYDPTSTAACTPTTTTPQICGATGFPGDSVIQLDSSYESSVSACAEFCKSYEGCLSIYSYQDTPDQIGCYLMGNAVANTDYHNTTSMGSGYTIYDISCFYPDSNPAACGVGASSTYQPRTVATSTSLPSTITSSAALCTATAAIVNGGFESSPLSIDPWMLSSPGNDYTYPFITSGEAYTHSGNNSLLVYKDAPQNNISWVLNQTVSICPSTAYTFTFWGRSNGERNPTHCPIEVCFGDMCNEVADVVDIDFTWMQFQSQYPGGAAATLVVSIATASCGQFILLDEISFDVAGSAPLPIVTASTVDCSRGFNSTVCEGIQGCYWSDYYAHCFPY
ncbi:hypothetical protein BP6252_08406 [Coleophoma cylindrospora]|uniref:Carbohydrate-binding module family 50 protein n=1 Tax=Coleophoma cylindrospora TaxID=1849047 RepID=A0A3D8R5V5_9HELO|nr:hypothetical protein BP6252_08406 [Coleophoma cylindrospora]